jgi:ribose transport system substrate-binding protein
MISIDLHRFRIDRRTWIQGAALLPLVLVTASCSTEPPPAPTPPNGPASASSSAGGANAPGPTASGSANALFATPRKADGTINIQIVTNGISPFWDPMAIGMKKAAEEEGCQADWSGPRDSTVVEQKRMIEDALAKGADGLAISCIEAEASIPIIDSVIEKKIPCITFDSDSPKSKRLVYIGTNNFNAGKAAGEAAVKLFPKGGKFVGFVGNISAQNARERRDGFLEAIKGHGIDLIDVIDDNKDPARAQRNVEEAITKNGDKIQGFLGLFSYNGPAIVRAVTGANLRSKYKIVCFDAEPQTLLELEKGNVDATVVQKPYDFGLLSTKLLYLINRKGIDAAKKELKIPDDGIYDTGVEVITPESVKAYKANLEKLGIKSS